MNEVKIAFCGPDVLIDAYLPYLITLPYATRTRLAGSSCAIVIAPSVESQGTWLPRGHLKRSITLLDTLPRLPHNGRKQI